MEWSEYRPVGSKFKLVIYYIRKESSDWLDAVLGLEKPPNNEQSIWSRWLEQKKEKKKEIIVDHLSWTSVFQDTTTNHASGHIVVFRNSSKPGFIGPFKESWRYMLSSLLPSEWTWHCVYPIWQCSGFSIIFQDGIFHESPMIFQDEYLIGLIINSFPIPYPSWLVFIHPSLLQDRFQGVY